MRKASKFDDLCSSISFGGHRDGELMLLLQTKCEYPLVIEKFVS